MKKIILTGGGTAGHVNPNIALLPYLKENNYTSVYIGSYNGIEKDLIEKNTDLKYYAISSGKLRRYFDIKNFTDPFRIIKGLFQSISILKKEKPDIIFSKGGFVTVPVVIAGYLCKIPIVIHESDYSIGLANKIATKFSNVVCTSFKETANSSSKGIFTGPPLRDDILTGNKENGYKITKFNKNLPIILIIGGSLGAGAINEFIFKNIDILSKQYQIIHICGKGNKKDISNENYFSIEYANEELKDLFAISDIVISRAGSNAVFELLALKIPHILIPLPLSASRGDQILNANSHKKQGFCEVINEEDLSIELLINILNKLESNKEYYINNMSTSNLQESNKKIIEIIKKHTK